MVNWSNSHGLVLNVSKCKTMHFKKSHSTGPVDIDDVSLVDEMRILGVVIDNRLKWNSHIDYLVSTGSRRMYALRVLKPLLSPEDLLRIYYGLIRSLLEYAAPVFVCLPDYLADRLEHLQRRVHRLICGEHINESTCSKFPPLKTRRMTAATRLFRRAHQDNSHCLHSIIPDISPHSGRFIQPISNSSRFSSTFIPLVTAALNGTHIE